MKTMLGFVLAVAMVVLVSGCASHSDSTKATASNSTAGAPAMAESINRMCPIGGEEADKAVTTTYKGKTVAFCCPGCIEGWNKLSDADKDSKLAAAMK